MASEQCMLGELMHDNPARVTNGRQVLDADATHIEIQEIKKGDGAYQVLHRSPLGLQEVAGGCQKPCTFRARHTTGSYTRGANCARQ